MMYTLPKFESEEAASSQAKHLQTVHRWTWEHEKCSNGGQKYMYRSLSMNRRYNKQGRYHFNSPENEYKQHMQQSIKHIA